MGIGGVVVGRIDLLSGFEQLCHLVAVEHLLPVLPAAPPTLPLEARHRLIRLGLVAVPLHIPAAEVFQEVGAVLGLLEAAEEGCVEVFANGMAIHVMRNKAELYMCTRPIWL